MAMAKNRDSRNSQDSLLVRKPDSRSKGCEFESRQERRENFLLQCQLCVLTLIRCPFHPMLPQWHVKGPGHSAKGAGGMLHPNTHTPLTQRCRGGLTMLSRHSVGSSQGSELTRFSSGNARPQFSQLAEPLWTDLWPEEWSLCARVDSSHHHPQPPQPRKKKAQVQVVRRTFHLHFRMREKATSAWLCTYQWELKSTNKE